MIKGPFEKLHDTAEPARAALQQMLIKQAVFHTCFNCDHMNKQTGESGRYKIRPPIEVIVFGCPTWEEEIPF